VGSSSLGQDCTPDASPRQVKRPRCLFLLQDDAGVGGRARRASNQLEGLDEVADGKKRCAWGLLSRRCKIALKGGHKRRLFVAGSLDSSIGVE